jgi:hypothetical protein
MPGAHENIYWLVTKATVAGGGYRLGHEYTLAQLRDNKDPNMRDLLEIRLRFFEDIIALTEATERYKSETGKEPDRELRELVKKGYVKDIPKEPYGGQYYYDGEKRMVVTSSEKILRPPEEKKEEKKK